MDPKRHRWIDEAAGPLVRPYAMTRGRVRARGEQLDVITIVASTGRRPTPRTRLSPEQRQLLTLCAGARTIADLASDSGLPLGVVHVLLGDLLEHGLIAVRPAPQPAADPDQNLLRRVLDDLRAL